MGPSQEIIGNKRITRCFYYVFRQRANLFLWLLSTFKSKVAFISHRTLPVRTKQGNKHDFNPRLGQI